MILVQILLMEKSRFTGFPYSGVLGLDDGTTLESTAPWKVEMTCTSLQTVIACC